MAEEVEKFQFIELEKDSIKAFMQDRKTWVDLKDHIDPTYYNDKNISKIFKIFVAYFNKYKDFPSKKQMKTIFAKKNMNDKELSSSLNEIYDEGDLSLAELGFIKDEMVEFVKISKMERAILGSVDLIEEKKYQDVYDLVTEAVHWNPDINLGTNYSNVEERFAKLADLMINITETPWPRISHFLGGGFFRKELYLFAASSSVGKSIALDQVALHCWEKLGLNVALITFEMSEERKGQRMDACKFGIPVTKIYDNKNMIIETFEREGHKNKLFIKEMPQTNSSADIEQYLYQLELYEGIKPDIIIIDYMDIMAPRMNKTGKDYDDQGAVGADLRDLAKSYNIPVVSACLGINSILITTNGEKKLYQINIGDKVLSRNGVYNTVLNKKLYQQTKLFKVKTKSGKEIICSEKHLFPTASGDEKSIENGLNVGSLIYSKKINSLTDLPLI